MLVAAVAAATVTLAASSDAAPKGVLSLSTSFTFKWGPPAPCPAGIDPSVSSCLPQTALAPVRGLGAASVSSLAVITETPVGSGCWRWQISGALAVAGKGDLAFSAVDSGCQQQTTATLAYTIASGTRKYAGASGSGTFAIPSFKESNFTGIQMWAGTLDVPGLEFDTAPPKLRGIANRKARAKTKAGVRVRFAVTATDAVDGAVPAVCKPRSGSRFKIGKTAVRCTATDTSANAASAAFKVTVRR